MVKIQQRSDEAERYSSNLRLYGKKATPEENIRVEILKLFAAPQDKEKMASLLTPYTGLAYRGSTPTDLSSVSSPCDLSETRSGSSLETKKYLKTNSCCLMKI
ncbi:hypothetical protein AMECASPLE_037386 [Ameca splendens]|uniref:Uncharacterized protein n=1 Tax=Ameca splendens TaxID=208324 RepID=A0ABV1A5E7_9TELE